MESAAVRLKNPYQDLNLQIFHTFKEKFSISPPTAKHNCLKNYFMREWNKQVQNIITSPSFSCLKTNVLKFNVHLKYIFFSINTQKKWSCKLDQCLAAVISENVNLNIIYKSLSAHFEKSE